MSLFIYPERETETERERERESREGAEREKRERIPSRCHTANTEPDMGLDTTNWEMMT